MVRCRLRANCSSYGQCIKWSTLRLASCMGDVCGRCVIEYCLIWTLSVLPITFLNVKLDNGTLYVRRVHSEVSHIGPDAHFILSSALIVSSDNYQDHHELQITPTTQPRVLATIDIPAPAPWAFLEGEASSQDYGWRQPQYRATTSERGLCGKQIRGNTCSRTC